MATVVMEKPVTGPRQGYAKYFQPLTNVSETDNEILLLCEMPGADENSVEVKVEKDVLTVAAATAQFLPEGRSWTYAETALANYRRSFKISQSIDRDNVQASMKSGILKLVLPKKVPPVHKIQVKTE